MAAHLRAMDRILGGWNASCVTWLELGNTTGRVWQPPNSKLHRLALFSMSSCLGARMTGTGVGGALLSWKVSKVHMASPILYVLACTLTFLPSICTNGHRLTGTAFVLRGPGRVLVPVNHAGASPDTAVT